MHYVLADALIVTSTKSHTTEPIPMDGANSLFIDVSARFVHVVFSCDAGSFVVSSTLNVASTGAA